jgi:hypothetical protein
MAAVRVDEKVENLVVKMVATMAFLKAETLEICLDMT